MSYYDEDTQTWKCQDHCLKLQNDTLCGETDHLTNFALLLSGGGGGSGGNKNKCGADDPQLDSFFWLSLAFVLGAILICIITSILYDLKKRHDRAALASEISSRLSVSPSRSG